MAKWQLVGKLETPGVRCFCPLMHLFSWDSRNPPEEILDCDAMYIQEEEDDLVINEEADNPLPGRMPPFTPDGQQELSTEIDMPEDYWPGM
ncbi:TPA: hypothetical protein ACHWTD_004722 [Escherichia coli]